VSLLTVGVCLQITKKGTLLEINCINYQCTQI